MQAYGRYDFNATADDELSFPKGAVLKILNSDEDINWCKAELKGKEGYVPKNYIDIVPHPWYLGKVSRTDAERILLQKDANSRGFIQPDGAFLVRVCESSPGDFSLSAKYQDQVQHFKILRDGMGKYFLWAVKFDSVNELIDYHRTTSVNRGQVLLLRDMISTTSSDKMPNYNDKKQPQPQSQSQTNQWTASKSQGQQQQQQQQQPQQSMSNVSPQKTGQMYEAAYDFQPQEEGEIELKRGDRIRMLDQSDIHWWKGEVRGNVGLFPATYVRPL